MAIEGSDKLLKGTFWAFLGQISYILIALIGNVILARLLMPREFGMIGIAMFFVNLASVLIDGGLGGALIRKENAEEKDYSTMLLFNLGIGFFLLGFTMLIADAVAKLYYLPALKNVIIALSSIFIFNALSLVHSVKLVKEMAFKKISLYRLIAILLATLIAIVLAYLNCGVWSIVSLQILSSLFLTVIYWSRESNVKRFVFSKKSFSEMYKFGVFTTLSSVITTLSDNVYQLLIGKYFSLSSAGLYYQAKRLQEVIDGPIKNVLYNVVYSHLSKLQSEELIFKRDYKLIAKWVALASSLITCLLIIYSEQAITILFGEKWIKSTLYLQLLGIASFFSTIEIVYGNLFRIFNKTNRLLYLELLKKLIQLLSIVVGMYFHSIEYLLGGFIITSIIGYGVTFYISRIFVDDLIKMHIRSLMLIIINASFSVVSTVSIFYLFKIEGVCKIPFVLIFLLIFFFGASLLKIENIIKLIKAFKHRKMIFE